MKIEVGKKYRTRDNRIVKVIYTEKLGEYPIVALLPLRGTNNEAVESYKVDGAYTNREHPLDIISEAKTVKYLKPLHEVIKNMEWDVTFQRFNLYGSTGRTIIANIQPNEFEHFGKELPPENEWLYQKDWIVEREV